MSKHLTGTALIAVATLGMAIGLADHASADDHIHELEPSSEPLHLRVHFQVNPQHEAVVSWTTTEEGQHHRLYVSTEPQDGELDAYPQVHESDLSQPYTLREEEAEAGMDAWGHNVYLDGLEPATDYYITAVSEGADGQQQSDEFYFRTAPADDREVKLLLTGDSRVGGARTHEDNNRRRVNRVMRDLFERHPEVVAMGHGADYTNRAYWAELYYWLKDHHEETTTEDGRLLPIIASRGNHDLDVGFEEMFWWPDRERDYYFVTQLSGEAVYITLNTEISIGGDQADWLAEQMPALRSTNRWVAGQWHRPAYPSVRDYGGGRAPAVRETWVPIFETYGLDLGYEAHDHALKRTYPIYQGEVDADRGIIYIGDGGGGVPQRQPEPERWYLEVTGRHHHAHLLTFGDDVLHVKARSIQDEVVDAFSIEHDRRDRAE